MQSNGKGGDLATALHLGSTDKNIFLVWSSRIKIQEDIFCKIPKSIHYSLAYLYKVNYLDKYTKHPKDR